MARPLGELRAAYARADLIALDLDECVFPTVSQEALGKRIAWRLLRRPERRGDRRFLPKLLVGGTYRALTHAKRFFGGTTPSQRLIAWFEWTMRGVPETYFAQAARKLPKRSHALAAETIALLASHAPTGLVTLGLDIVAQAYVEQWSGLSFFEANRVVFQPGPGRRNVFAGYDHEQMLASGEDKRRAVERRLDEMGASVPLIIGHSRDDLPLARLARERGGLAVGFNPSQRLWDEFDAIATGPDWESVYALVAILAFGRHIPPAVPVPKER